MIESLVQGAPLVTIASVCFTSRNYIDLDQICTTAILVEWVTLSKL